MEEDDTAGFLCGILGETGLRLEDGLRLEWNQIDMRRRQLSKWTSKGNKVVYIQLSDYAIELLSQATRIVGCPYVFAAIGTRKAIAKPRKILERARKKVNLEWVGFHDFRHFRGSQWVMRGVDIRTVKELLGHANIQTTMRYAHFAPNYAAQSVIEAQQKEQQELAAATDAAGNK